MKNKINQIKTIQNKEEILSQLFDRNLISSNETIVIASGFENAIIGVTDTVPKKITYDYWVCIDILLKTKDIGFDEAQDWLDAFSLLNNDKKNNESVLFVRTLNPALNY